MSRIIDNPKELIFNISKEIAYSEGISNISMRKVANKANLAIGTIYNYYPTKVDIIFDIIQDFWCECFVSIDKVYDLELDFFQQLEKFYFYILEYLERFESNWIKELSDLSSENKSKGKKKEAEFMSTFMSVFRNLINKHMDEFNKTVFLEFGEEKIVQFILEQFFIMLKRFEHDYSFFDCVLRKLLL